MLITAIFELFRRNALGYSAFGLYGTFFMATSIYTFGQVRGWFFLPSPKGQQAAAALVGIASFIFMASSAAICVLLVRTLPTISNEYSQFTIGFCLIGQVFCVT